MAGAPGASVQPRADTPNRWLDVMAGVSIAGLLLPEAVAYSSIAALPPQAGVIALFAGLLCYGLFGTSRFAIVSATYLSGCGDSDKPSASVSDTTAVYSPVAMDDDDRALNESDVAGESSAAMARCTTYHSTRMNSGRRLWKINKPLWKYFIRASVTFSDGYRVDTVIVGKANRKADGFVFRRGESTPNIIAIWAPRGNKSTRVTVCAK